jgi:hypothetical protein
MVINIMYVVIVQDPSKLSRTIERHKKTYEVRTPGPHLALSARVTSLLIWVHSLLVVYAGTCVRTCVRDEWYCPRSVLRASAAMSCLPASSSGWPAQRKERYTAASHSYAPPPGSPEARVLMTDLGGG